MQTLIHNARLVLPDRIIEDGWLLIDDERINDFGENATCPAGSDYVVNAQGQWLLPGLIDLHCDAIERLVQPRPSVHFDIHTALSEADWRLAGTGITTEFHAVSLDDGEFGVRSTAFVRDLYSAIKTGTDLLIRHRIHTRFELSSEQGFVVLKRMIKRKETDLISLMDHSPGQGQYLTEESFRNYVIRTASKSNAEIDALLTMKRVQATNIPARIEQVTRVARETGIAIATHDDDTAQKVQQWPPLGVTVSEFPTTLEAAQCAHELGLAVCMGAPNVLLGKSSGGNLSAIVAVKAGIANVLCSDYYPGAMLAAAFKLAEQQICTLPEAVKLVTLHPAKAVHLGHEYGSVEIGKLADLILVRINERGIPKVQRVLIGGKEVLIRA